MKPAALSLPPVVDAEWLESHHDEVLVADVRWYLDGRDGYAAYLQGHIPGAVFVDLPTALSGPGSPATGRHPLPAPEDFADAMGALGISDTTAVVAYDDAGGIIAARMVWMLRAIGHPAALLDGGIEAWNGTLTPGEESRPPASFSPVEWPADAIVDIDEVALAPAPVVKIDARDRSRYEGGPDSLDPRSGHIPGAHSAFCRENLDEHGRFRSADELRQRFASLGISSDTPVISSCGSGVTACHNLLALEVAGLGDAKLYPGSWSQWSADPSRDVVTGAEPG